MNTPTEGNDVLTGTSDDDIIDALGGDDFIEGLGGADTIDGGEGFDTVSYENSSEGVTRNQFTSEFTGGDSTGDTVVNVEAFIGTNFDDDFNFGNGSGSLPSFFGLNGNDTLDLRSRSGGVDDGFEFVGGAGNDNLFIRSALDDSGDGFNASVFEGGEGIDIIEITGSGSIDFSGMSISGFEVLNFAGNVDNYIATFTADQFQQFTNVDTRRGSGTLEINILMEAETELDLSGVSTNGSNGSADDFFIFGDADAEVIIGTDRADVIDGAGRSDDISGGTGNDTLFGGGGKDTLNGDDGDDTIEGNIGNDTITGGAGDDTVRGGNNRDTIDGGDGADFLRGNNGVDFVNGDAGDDRVEGGNGNDRLDGGDGNDKINGGAGKDTLTGGEGSDTFIFNSADESPNTTSSDIITDFEVGVDFIDLSALAETMSFIGEGDFSGTGAEVRFKASGQNTIIRADVDGDGTADFKIVLNDIIDLSEADFIL